MSLLSSFYPSIKALHILSVIAWMAGILYLPRLFVYHVKHKGNADIVSLFLLMERRLVAFIIWPAMTSTVLTGAALLHIPQAVDWSKGTVYVKLFFVGLLLGLQHFFLRCKKNLERGQNRYSEKFFRFANEVPFVLAIIITFLVVLKPL